MKCERGLDGGEEREEREEREEGLHLGVGMSEIGWARLGLVIVMVVGRRTDVDEKKKETYSFLHTQQDLMEVKCRLLHHQSSSLQVSPTPSRVPFPPPNSPPPSPLFPQHDLLLLFAQRQKRQIDHPRLFKPRCHLPHASPSLHPHPHTWITKCVAPTPRTEHGNVLSLTLVQSSPSLQAGS